MFAALNLIRRQCGLSESRRGASGVKKGKTFFFDEKLPNIHATIVIVLQSSAAHCTFPSISPHDGLRGLSQFYRRLSLRSTSQTPAVFTMDIVLEVLDTFIFDAVWATVLPGSASHTSPKPLQNAITSTYSSMREMATGGPQATTQFFQLEPSRYAYMSAWPRDNIYRQGITLYLITWCALSLAMSYANRRNLADLLWQDFRSDYLFPMRRPFLPLRLRPRHLHTSKIPQKSSCSRDQTDHDLYALDVHLHSAALLVGSSRLRKAIRRPFRCSIRSL